MSTNGEVEQIECEHFGRMIYPQECAICSGAVERLYQQQKDVERPVIITAQYEGQCQSCNLPITIGQRISWTRGRPVVHEECDSAS